MEHIVRTGLAAACALALVAHALAAPQACSPEEARLTASDGQPWDHFGGAVAVSGELALVGASAMPGGLGPGKAYVYLRDGAGWSQETILQGSDVGGYGDGFGAAVALHGDRAVIGAPGHVHDGLTCGSAYVFRREGTSWIEEAELVPGDAAVSQGVGASVAIHGDVIVVGAPNDDQLGWSAGAAYVFAFDGASWVQQAKLLASDGTGGRQLGRAVTISGDWIAVSAVHELGYPPDAGFVYVYSRRGDTWLERGQLVRSDGLEGQYFGRSLCMDGDTLLVGAPGDGSAGVAAGAAHVYARAGDDWIEQVKLFAWDADQGDFFGISVAVSGDTALIGAYREGDGATFPGSAYWFSRQGSSWIRRLKLRASSSGDSGDEFGRAISVGGETALVGAPNAGDLGFLSGAATVFHVPPPPGILYCTCADGPCWNPDADAGCANSTAHGAQLTAHGRTLPDELDLHLVDAPPGQWAILVQGNDRVELPFGDGMQCAGHGLVRINVPASLIGADGTLGYGPCFGDATISSRTGVVPGSGTTARYQAWYRDPAGPCGSHFNLSNGYEVVW